jgi:hypothetical protein
MDEQGLTHWPLEQASLPGQSVWFEHSELLDPVQPRV